MVLSFCRSPGRNYALKFAVPPSISFSVPNPKRGCNSTWPDSRTRTTTRTRTKHIVARSSEGRRYRKQPKIDALRQYKEEILEAHRSGLSVHRIAQIFRERGVDISVPHLVRTVRRFIDEEERAQVRGPPLRAGPASPMAKERHPESAAAEETKPKAPVTYQISEQPSAKVQEEEFAKQLRLARYLAAGGSPPARSLEPLRQPRTPKQARPVAKARAKTKAETVGKKAREEELAKERRRAGRTGQKVRLPGSGRGEKQRHSPGR